MISFYAMINKIIVTYLFFLSDGDTFKERNEGTKKNEGKNLSKSHLCLDTKDILLYFKTELKKEWIKLNKSSIIASTFLN